MSAHQTTRRVGHQRMQTDYFYARENTLDSIMFTYHRAAISPTPWPLSFSPYFATRCVVCFTSVTRLSPLQYSNLNDCR